jgi:DNA processing protein
VTSPADNPVLSPTSATDSACIDCRRRSWLLAELSPILDLNCRADGRLFELLALDDLTLMQAIGGRRRAELQRGHARFGAGELAQVRPIPRAGAPGGPYVQELCVHDPRYPHELELASLCPLLHVAGGVHRLHELTQRPVVAFAGAPSASDYGREVSSELARGLSASGVTVAALQLGGVAAAALAGTLQSNGAALTVAGSGLDVATRSKWRSLRTQLSREGCAVSELPCGTSGRRWGLASAARVLAGLATVTLIVEAEDSRRDLAVARVATSLDREVAAIPGRVTSSMSRGTHVLLREGAQLVRDAADVLDLLSTADHPAPMRATLSESLARLEPRLRAMLERVGAGADTPGKLAGEKDDAGEVLRTLSELELLGLLSRGDGGRYVVRASVRR